MEIAIVAHDAKKKEMLEFIKKNKAILSKEGISLIATGTTGSMAQDVGFEVKRMLSGPLGGDAQIAGRVAEGKTAMVLFFKDPLGKHPHEPDINMLLRVCDVHNVPLATNVATAQMLLQAIDSEVK
ncbi:MULTISPECIES: methylglyoxal synthase [Myroides]|uniref:Methylglyoxal synthase n=1 Tax=Myroides albus TaxID=2562892 RepID=A0A6I3LM35_9FLAO|nr:MULTISPECIES: methylglyoxal synthase [Myroides]MTG97621.1 methylglyoxal synthase [Myroides albus]MVX36759.1 methylglyoxal synthase [Myroides sp. LoEW2-1]UVD79245.1 methylglyoxal synthase [Myroides albus]